MKTLLVKAATPVLVISGLIAVGVMAIIKKIEDSHDDEYFYE